MAKQRRKINIAKEARRRARTIAGPLPAGHVIPDKRTKPLKHKRKIVEEDFA